MQTCTVYTDCVKPVNHPDLHRNQDGKTIHGPVEKETFLRSVSDVDNLTGMIKPLEPLDMRTVVTSSSGAIQSKQEYACGSADVLAMLAMAKVQAEGDAKYGKDNWRGVSEEDHLAHLLTHVHLHRAGDTSESHLAHALTRAMMAMAVHLRPDYYGDWTPGDRKGAAES